MRLAALAGAALAVAAIAAGGHAESTPTQLVAADGAAYAGFGMAAAAAGDGSIAIIGAPRQLGLDGSTNAGGAYVFSSGNWKQPATRLPTPAAAAGDMAGGAVAVTAAGGGGARSIALVGAPNATRTVVSQGIVFVFGGSAATGWALNATLAAPDAGAGDQFGASVAVDSAGAVAIIGAPGRVAAGGAAYIATQSTGAGGGVWAVTQSLPVPSGGVSFGDAVAVCANASVALVTDSLRTVGSNRRQGAAFVFARDAAGLYVPATQLTASDGAPSDSFGRAAAMSADGSVAIVGADMKLIASGGQYCQGAAYIFERQAGGWVQAAALACTPGVMKTAYFGGAVALSANASQAFVAAYAETDGVRSQAGAVYVYQRAAAVPAKVGTAWRGRLRAAGAGGEWSLVARLQASDSAGGDFFGRSLAAGPAWLIAGVPGRAVGGNASQGIALVYDSAWR